MRIKEVNFGVFLPLLLYSELQVTFCSRTSGFIKNKEVQTSFHSRTSGFIKKIEVQATFHA
ncbi:hypothetical protein BW721_02165 [Jeotgalibaca sp. PTS2502]|nr:hypothetical protein BW721_02165 [Jeotgalibaca sp. PTS2502]